MCSCSLAAGLASGEGEQGTVDGLVRVVNKQARSGVGTVLIVGEVSVVLDKACCFSPFVPTATGLKLASSRQQHMYPHNRCHLDLLRV